MNWVYNVAQKIYWVLCCVWEEGERACVDVRGSRLGVVVCTRLTAGLLFSFCFVSFVSSVMVFLPSTFFIYFRVAIRSNTLMTEVSVNSFWSSERITPGTKPGLG